MYYFEVLELLQERPEQRLSTIEICELLKRKIDIQPITVRKTLLKLTLKHPHIYREDRKVNNSSQGYGYIEYVYFFKD